MWPFCTGCLLHSVHPCTFTISSRRTKGRFSDAASDLNPLLCARQTMSGRLRPPAAGPVASEPDECLREIWSGEQRSTAISITTRASWICKIHNSRESLAPPTHRCSAPVHRCQQRRRRRRWWGGRGPGRVAETKSPLDPSSGEAT